ncbi:MAG: HDOD domain-containing protein [Candidatus Eisenbacteria bacterium]|uniref:HDOD domain-containing protein n=1 Tax=Eiseniibacteriota bacterium TaxID=2212470 RepID=A0A956LVK1_UNCEI|nr:HDOD domain-containing protein [Candidatus Eisenbacteria bacterium]
MIDLDALIHAAGDMEPLPASVSRLAQLVTDVDSDVIEIVRVIELDQVLTGNLLRSANSVTQAAVNPITTVRAAVTRLGYGSILSLATATSLQKRLRQSVPECGLSEGKLWRSSMAGAIAVDVWSRVVTTSAPPVAATAALLRDIGKLALGRFLTPDVREVLEEAEKDGHLSAMMAEREVLTVHHGELSGLIVQNWKLPELIVAGVTLHHDPDEVDGSAWTGRRDVQAICDMVYLADAIAWAVETEMEDPGSLELLPGPCRRMGIAPSKVGLVVEKTRDRVNETLAAYS